MWKNVIIGKLSALYVFKVNKSTKQKNSFAFSELAKVCLPLFIKKYFANFFYQIKFIRWN